MTKKELLKKLIALYTEVGGEITEENWWAMAYERRVLNGVCRASKDNFRISIRWEDWVGYWNRFKDDDPDYWIKPIFKCKSFPEALANIETRIELMTHELCSGIKD